LSEPTACTAARCHPDSYCDRCDLLVGLDGFHVVAVSEYDGKRGPVLRVVVETPQRVEACRSCGVVAGSHGRREVRLVDVPCMGRPVELWWRKRTWRCGEPDCPAGSFTEVDEALVPPRALLTTRACWWAIGQLGAVSLHIVIIAERRRYRQPSRRSRVVFYRPRLSSAPSTAAAFDRIPTLKAFRRSYGVS
jgi:hypothetical protein